MFIVLPTLLFSTSFLNRVACPCFEKVHSTMASQDLPDPDDADIERRFLAAGVVVPADRAVGAYAAARRLLATLHWLRQPRPAAAEPSHIFLPGQGTVP